MSLPSVETDKPSVAQPLQNQSDRSASYAAVLGRKHLGKLIIPPSPPESDLSARQVSVVSQDSGKPKESSKFQNQQAMDDVVPKGKQDESQREHKGSPKSNSSASSSSKFWKMKAARLKTGKKSPESVTSASQGSLKSFRSSPSPTHVCAPTKSTSKAVVLDVELDAFLESDQSDLSVSSADPIKVSMVPIASHVVAQASKVKVVEVVSPASFWSAKSRQFREKSRSSDDVSSGSVQSDASRVPNGSPLPASSPVDPLMGDLSPAVLRPRPMSAPPQRQDSVVFDPEAPVLFDILEPDDSYGVSPSELRFSQRNVSCCLADGSMTVLGLRDVFTNDGWDYSRKPLLVVRMPDNRYTSYDNRRLYAAKWAEDLTGSCDVGIDVHQWNGFFRKKPPESDIDIPKLLYQFERLAHMKGLGGYVKQPHYSYGDMVIVRMFAKDYFKNDGHLYDASRIAFGYDSYPFITPMFGATQDECDAHLSHVKKAQEQI
jgi:hypothetical protein